MRHLILLLAVTLIPFGLRSQDFNYTVAADSVTWNELNTQTILNTSNSAWNFSYRIPIGFTFNYLDHNFDSLTIETNGYLVFDANRSYAFSAVHGFGDCIDSSGTHSVLGYEVTGASGNHILKVQYKNTGKNNASSKLLSYQIWLHEATGKIELRIGTSDFGLLMSTNTLSVDSMGAVTSVTTYAADTIPTQIGLLNMNMNSLVSGYLLSGNNANVTGQQIAESSTTIPAFMLVPRMGYRFSFQPL